MRHHDHRHPSPFDGADEFDSETADDAGADLTTEFWGSERGWNEPTGRTTRVDRSTRSDDTTGTIRAIRDGMSAFRPQRVALRDATGQVKRTRVHGQVAIAPTANDGRADATIGQLAAGHFDEPIDERLLDADIGRHEVELDQPVTGRRLGLGAVDPLLARLGALVVVGVLLVPFALALRSADAAPDSVSIDAPAVDAAAGELSATVVDGAAVSTEAATDPGSSQSTTTADGSSTAAPAEIATLADQAGATGTETASPADVATTQTASATTQTDPAVGDVTQSVSGAIDEAATVEASAERVVPECPQTYTAAAGDSWYRIADAAGVAPSAVLDENRATVDTVIFPGDEICLPSDATIPSPPATTKPATTQPSSTQPATTQPATTTPATTQPATTVPSGSPGRNASVAEVKDVIRSVFPESQWETAFTIADRESGFDPTAYNGWCCYGVFQMYWNVHKGWLDDLGIDSADDLYDPLLNVKAAYALYQRSGNSWRPWSTYDG